MEWFDYDHMPHGDRIPKGELCGICSKLAESVPGVSPDTIKQQLSSGSNDDLAFQVMWEVGKRRVLNKIPLTWRMGTVSNSSRMGMRSEWVYHFVENSAFLKKTQHDMETKGLRLKTFALTDPEGKVRTGALFRPEEVPTDLPFVRVTLYRDEGRAWSGPCPIELASRMRSLTGARV